jgi:hypothetical protein
MTTTIEPPKPIESTRESPADRRRRRVITDTTWAIAVFAAFTIVYLTVGLVLYRIGYVNPDASSRVANAGYALESRFPHLGAVGFVWNPLPSFIEIPLLELSRWWPPIESHGFAAVLQSAPFMAGAVVMVRRIAIDRSAPSVVRWLAVAAFGLHPMIVLYGAHGMSEAPFIYLLVWACRRLLKWMQTFAVTDLLVCGIALSLAYLTRLEGVVAAGAVAVTTFAISTLRNRAGRRWRDCWLFGLHDAVILIFPTVCAVTIWALAGWLLVGSALDSVTSQYGNTAQVTAAGITTTRDALGITGTAASIAAQTFGMQPLVIVVLAIVIAYAISHRNADIAAPIAIFGSILVFQAVAILAASTYGWFRFFIPAVPLAVIALLVVSTGVDQNVRDGSDARRRTPIWSAPLLAAVMLTSIPVAWSSMLTPAIGKEEFGLRSAIWPDRYPRSEHWLYWTDDMAQATAKWFDEQNSPPGSVLVDTFSLGKTWLASDHPQQFVVRSDYDFFAKLNAPQCTGVRFILVPPPSGLGELDAINVRYPGLWKDGAGIATLLMKVTNPQGYEQFRIYRVIDQDPKTAPQCATPS